MIEQAAGLAPGTPPGTACGWLRAHGTTIVIGVLVVAGAIMVVNGIYGLAERG